MSISKGPWSYGQNEQNRYIKDANGNCIVAYNRAMFSASDARLLAAAPDLLDACIEFVRKVECGEAKSKRSYAQMTAAIKKATM